METEEKPKVSYLCSVRNGCREIERCAMSVLGQSLKGLELILIDDHSDDDTWTLMERVAKEDERVRAIRNYGREGLTYSLNLGLDFARGEYIARIDVDDFAHINKTESQVSLLDGNSTAVMATSCCRVVDEEDYEQYCHCPHSEPKMLKWSLCFRNNIRHSTAMWRRSLGFRYDPSFRYSQDYELWCRVSREGEILTAGEVLTTVRNKRESITNTKHNEQETAADMVASKQYLYYTGVHIGPAESRHLRMFYHLKSPEQFQVFNNMDKDQIRKTVGRYCRLAECFYEKEQANLGSLMCEIGHDVTHGIQNPAKGLEVREAVTHASDIQGSWIAKEMSKRFL
jgi:hypothetical protein